MKKTFLWLFFCVTGGVLAQPALQLRQQILTYNTEIAKARARNDLKSESAALSQLAFLYLNHKIYPDALKTFGQLLNVQTRLGNRPGMLDSHYQLGSMYRDLGKNKQSLAEFRLALPIAHLLHKQEQIYDLYHQTATVLASLGRNREAVADLQQALWMAQALKNTRFEQDTYFRIYRFYEAAGNKDMAMQYYKQFAGLLSTQQQQEIALKNAENRTQATTLAQVKDSLQTTADSLEKAETLNKQKSLEIKTLNQEKKIAELQAKEKESELENEIFRRNFILAFAGVLLLMAFFLLRDYRKIQALNRQSYIQQQEITAQNRRLEQSQTQLLVAQSTIQEQNGKLQSYNRDLEKQVQERTADLQKAYHDLLTTNNDLDILTYRASHDLKTPMASLEGLCNVALLEISPRNPAKVYFAKIKELAANMEAILNHLSRLRDIKHTSLKITRFSLTETLQKVWANGISQLPEAGSMQFITKLKEGTLLKTDEDLYALVLKNVLQNAVQFSLPPTLQHQPFVRIEHEETVSYSEIRVIDNGEGIPEEAAARIFNMFFRGSLRSKGAGLGLYTAKAAIEKLNGSLDYSQSPDHETVFTIRIPKLTE